MELTEERGFSPSTERRRCMFSGSQRIGFEERGGTGSRSVYVRARRLFHTRHFACTISFSIYERFSSCFTFVLI